MFLQLADSLLKSFGFSECSLYVVYVVVLFSSVVSTSILEVAPFMLLLTSLQLDTASRALSADLVNEA